VRLAIGETEIRVNITALAMPVFMLIAGLAAEYAAVFFSMLLHELSHISAARICGIKVGTISVTILGFSTVIPDDRCSKAERSLIYLAGPAFNLLLFTATLLLGRMVPGDQEFLRLLSASNLFLAFINLLPALPLDGGRLMLVLLAGKIGMLAAGRTMRWLAWAISAFIIITGVYQLYASSYNASLIIIGLYIMMITMTGKVESALMNIRQIIYRKSRLLKKGIYPARDLVAMKNTRLSDTLKSLDFDRFHIIHVLDDSLNIIGVFTENQIMDALISGNDDMTFECLIGK
jgi:stage IV sporulation protein FB